MLAENVNLTNYNTFGISSTARYFYTPKSENDLNTVIKECKSKEIKLKILGSGSNILFSSKINDAVAHNCIKGIKSVSQTNESIILEVGAGEIWHDFVTYCVKNSYQGLENLALIPGTVGAAPVQNIGAYGVEQKDCFHSLDAINISNNQKETFNLASSEFEYRDSAFKSKYREQFCITRVRYKLNKSKPPQSISYKSLIEQFNKHSITKPTICDVYNTVISIRQSKLPEAKELGNGGSFFKNPVITIQQYNQLKHKYGEMPYYNIDNQYVKIPAAYLIEQCGWKGYRKNNVGVHQHQALVIVNYGNAKTGEIIKLSEDIQGSVYTKYEITLEPEINIW